MNNQNQKNEWRKDYVPNDDAITEITSNLEAEGYTVVAVYPYEGQLVVLSKRPRPVTETAKEVRTEPVKKGFWFNYDEEENKKRIERDWNRAQDTLTRLTRTETSDIFRTYMLTKNARGYHFAYGKPAF